MSTIVTRFPPSPTGFFHIGSARTALFNYLFTVHGKGVMHLRFEDTDKKRSERRYEDDIIAGLKWLGLKYTLPEVFRQSERLVHYRKAIDNLLASEAAYISKEPAKDDPSKEVEVVRLKNPGTSVTFADLIRGDVTFETKELGDFVIARNVDGPLYHLTVVVDDEEMGVTHVIRGEDHISNTARQILILEALGYTRPQYAHIPLILAPDRSKLSKRHGAVSINEYRAEGYLPEALVNYLALLGWNPGGEQEVFTLAEICEKFTLEHVQKAGAVFDIEKLRWFNHAHLAKLSAEEYAERVKDFIKEKGAEVPVDLTALVPIIRERSKTLLEAMQFAIEYDELKRDASYTRELLLQNAKAEADIVKKHLVEVERLLQNVSDMEFTQEKVKETVFPYATESGRASVLWPMRVALSGKKESPDPFALSELLGKEISLSRVRKAIEMLENV